ncbi:hypothetical protein [Sorangium sp. So ce1078]|uniref:hypothetical protein n=1 Tax=Sorangium sp. So ce1078 TaxID=3133329 RepID=UPI003F62B954
MSLAVERRTVWPRTRGRQAAFLRIMAFEAALIALALLDGEHLANAGQSARCSKQARYDSAGVLEASFGLDGRQVDRGLGAFFRRRRW